MSAPVKGDLPSTWAFVEPGIEFILGGRDTDASKTKQVSPTMYMEVYTAIYNYCVNKSRASNAHSTVGNASILVGSEIYNALKEYLRTYVQSLAPKESESFLQFYVRRWKRYTIGAVLLNHSFDYMNRYWVTKERSDGRRDIYDVNTLCLMMWKENMFDPHSESLFAEIMAEIKAHRDNQFINVGCVTTAIQSFVAMGIDSQDLKKMNLNVYVQHFEKEYLDQTRQYYLQESTGFLAQHSIVDYVARAHQRIDEETVFASGYLDAHTNPLLTEALNDVMISHHAARMYEEFPRLLDNAQLGDVVQMYGLLKRDAQLLPQLAELYQSYIKQRGLEAIVVLQQEMSADAEARAQETSENKVSVKSRNAVDPKRYIKKLIELYQQFVSVTSQAFGEAPLFVKALDNAARTFINENSIALAGATKQSVSKTPEFLAKYADMLLKKSSKEEDVQDMSLDDVMVVFRFLTDKDAFETNYRRLFARRLIHGTSVSEEDEEKVISRLQSENSLEYTSKLSKMVQDVRHSRELELAWGETPFAEKQPEFQPFVLAETMWPFSYQPAEFKLPTELQPSLARLESIYGEKHNGRILKWLWNMSRGEIKANLSKPGRPPFLFTVTLYQTAILLAFNNAETLSLQQLMDQTGLNANTLASNLFPFVKLRLVQQQPPGLDALKKLETQFTVVSEYKGKRQKVNFQTLVKDVSGAAPRTERGEKEDVESELNGERQMFLEACIVRIMKARKTLQHSTLVNEVIQQSHQRFTAKVSLIKKSIDNLIDKEYLRRVNGDSYEYLA